MNIKPEEITSIIKKEIQRYGAQIQTIDSGTIIQIGDGIARVYGLDDCMQGELLEFPNGVFGMALNLEQDNVGCVLLGSEEGIKEGMEKGSELATENINKLLKILIVEKKYDEIEKISENKEYQKELMKKYNIIED